MPGMQAFQDNSGASHIIMSEGTPERNLRMGLKIGKGSNMVTVDNGYTLYLNNSREARCLMLLRGIMLITSITWTSAPADITALGSASPCQPYQC